jgi:hypothetical protein
VLFRYITSHITYIYIYKKRVWVNIDDIYPLKIN